MQLPSSNLFLTALILFAGSVFLKSQPTPPLQGNWTLTFQDEFDGTALDGTKWKVGQHFPGIAGDGGNSPEQITLEDGILKITVEERPVEFGLGGSYDYATGEISTFKNFNQRYGYYECRLRFHAVQGMWPAFWLMPDHEDYGWNGKNRKSFMKFDLSSISSGSVSSAVLKLTPTGVETGGGSVANVLVMKCPDDSWTESGLNWNNQPTPDPLFIKQLYGSSDLSVNTTTSVNVTDYINEELAGDGTASFAMIDSYMRNKLVTFASNEHSTQAYRPHLVIDGQTIYPSADSYVRESTPTTNYGSSNIMRVAEAYGSNDTASTFGDGNEVDIMESLGRWGPDRTQHAIHRDGYGSSQKSVESGHIAYPTVDGDDFHTYGLYWENGTYEFYIDGVKTYEWVNSEVMSSKAFVILSLQLGGWDGSTNANVDGRSLEVDYVRVWSGTKTGSATPGGGEGPAPSYTTVNVSEDAYVRSGTYASTNYGSAQDFRVKNASSTNLSRETYLKFDVSGLDPNAERFELVLDTPNGPSPRETILYMRTVSDDSWSESAITWNNKPSSGQVANSRRFKTTDRDFVMDITKYIRDEINGDGTASIRITAASDDAFSLFSSKESTTGTAAYIRATPGNSNYLTFATNDISSYGTNQDAGYGSVDGTGTQVSLNGNVWKKLPHNYTVTSNTVMRVTVDSSDVGEILGFGLDENNTHNDDFRLIQVGGSTTWVNCYQIDSSLEYFSNDGPIEYEVVLGSYYTGNMNYIILVGDDDADASTSVTFSNIQVFDDPTITSNVLTLEAETASGQSAFGPFQVVGDYIVVPNGTGNANGSSVTEPDGRASYTFTLSESANVTVNVYVDFPNGSDDSMWYKMDSGSWVKQNAQVTTLLTYTFNNLSAGSHTFSITRREDGSAIDRLIFTTSSGSISN